MENRANSILLDCVIAIALLRAVEGLPRLSSNILLQRIVRGVEFGSLSEPYQNSVHFGALSGFDARYIQITLDRLVFNGMLSRSSQGYSSACDLTDAGRKYMAAQSI